MGMALRSLSVSWRFKYSMTYRELIIYTRCIYILDIYICVYMIYYISTIIFEVF